MKKLITLFILVGIFIIPTNILAACKHNVFKVGTGIETDPYIISSEEHLLHINTHVEYESGIYFKQQGNIVLTKEPEKKQLILYSGKWSYDGDYNTITIKYKTPIVLFGMLHKGYYLKNLTIDGDPIYHFVQYNEGTIENVINKCDINNRKTSTSYDIQIGGIANTNHGGIIRNCRNEGNIDANTYNIGGIAGDNEGGLIEECSNTGNFKGTAPYGKLNVGGIAGKSHNYDPSKFHAVIRNCYTENITFERTGDFNDFAIGGIVGEMGNGGTSLLKTAPILENCYSLGINIIRNKYNSTRGVTGYGYKGFGIAGRNVIGTNLGIVRNSYYIDSYQYGVGDIYKNYDVDGLPIARIEYKDVNTYKYNDTQMKSPDLVKKLNASQKPIVWKMGSATYPYPIFIGKIILDLDTSTPKVGDNTLGKIMVTSSSNVDKIELYNKGSKKRLYYGEAANLVSVALDEGINTIGINAYDMGGNLLYESDSTTKIEKKNILNSVLGQINLINGLDKTIIIDGTNRIFDDNVFNQALVEEIKDSKQGIYIIYNEISPVLLPLLKR